ncbi:MAG: LysR family transcriptional regulator [Pygmaiobacter massiliensis]|nr:LysR family transcriptional regulator [Pygmaiobacter massiliensis]
MTRYEVFMKVVELASFTKTAQALGYTQSAVSQNVRALEEELDAVLLDRARNGIQLTPDGQAYLPYLQAVCQAHRQLAQKQKEMQRLERAVIRMGTFTSVSRNILPGFLKRFQQQYPQVEFVLEQGDYTSISRWVREGRVDLGFLIAEMAQNLENVTVCQDELMALLPKDHALAQKRAVKARQLADEPFILLGEGEYSVPLQMFKSQNLVPKVRYTVLDDPTIMAMVEEGLGVSALYHLVLRRTGGQLVSRPFDPPIRRTIVLAWQKRSELPRAARCFLDFFCNNMPFCVPASESED